MNKHIYTVCAEKTKKALQAFCDAINKSDAQIRIVMAQKAICMYELLVRQGLICEDNIEVYTNVAVAYGEIDFAGKRVAIIDDIIVSGAAISKIAHLLTQLGVDEDDLEIIALAKDTEYQTMKFTNSVTNQSILTCAYSLSDDDCIELSYDISNIIAQYGMPYDADFPIYNELSVASAASFTEKIISYPLWETFNVTNQHHRVGGICVLTLFPLDIIKKRLWDRIGVDLSTFVHLKVRVYIKENIDKSASVQVVPMALLKELSENSVKSLCSWFEKNHFKNAFWNPEWETLTKFRFLHYYIAHQLSIIIDEELNCTFSTHNSAALCIQFGLRNPTDLINSLECKKRFAYIEKMHFEHIEPETFNHGSILTDNEAIESEHINRQLLSLFTERHINEEMKARAELKYPQKHFLKNYREIRDIAYRLRKGFSLSALVAIAAPLDEKYYVEKLVSLFVDRAIDTGIAVPIFYHNNEKNYYCRAYRHGEDLPFGSADQYRLLYFLQCLSTYLTKYDAGNKVATVTFEKFIVLFYQIGIRRGNIFNRFLGFDNYPLLRQKYCVHGAIGTISHKVKSHIYAEEEPDDPHGRWLTVFISEGLFEGVIEREVDSADRHHYIINDKKVYELLSSNKLNNISNEIKYEIKGIAEVITKWYSLSIHGKDAFKEDITALTSCSDAFTFASALATELHYFKRYRDVQLSSAIESLLDEEGPTFLYHRTTQALHSGCLKANWYKTDRANEVIDYVGILLEENGGNWTLWRDIWKDKKSERYNSEIEEKIQEGLCYLYFYSLCYEWLCSDRVFETNYSQTFRNSSEKALRFSTLFSRSVKNTSKVSPKLLSIFEEAEAEQSITARLNLLINYLDRVLIKSEALVESIEAEILTNAKNYSVRYDSCLIFEMKCSKESAEDLLLNFWASIEENDVKTRLNIIQFGEVNGFMRFGVFYRRETDEVFVAATDILIKSYMELRRYSVSLSCVTRAIYIPQLPAFAVFRHDLKAHISEYASDFSRIFLNYAAEKYLNRNVHQLLVVQITKDGICVLPASAISFEKQIPIEEMSIPDAFEHFKAWIMFTEKELKSSSKENCSTISISDAENELLGTGVLISINGSLYCITCAHLFLGSVGPEYLGRSKDGRCNFLLERNTFGDTIDCYREDISAYEDLAILRARSAHDLPIDLTQVFSVDDFILSEVEANAIKLFKCFGFPDTRGSYVHNISFIGEGGFEFYLLEIPKDHRIGPGFSGAGIVPMGGGKLLGIHSAHRKNQLYCIPAEVIIKKINDFLADAKEEGN